MDTDLESAYNSIMEAVCAEDIFGSLTDPLGQETKEAMLEKAYNRLSSIADPLHYRNSPDDRDLATDARARLDEFHARAKFRISEGIYNLKQKSVSLKKIGRLILKTAKREYFIGEELAEGTVSTVFEGECTIRDEFAGQVVVKIMNDPADNELAWREKLVLTKLHAGNGAQRKHLPILLDQFETSDGRVGLIFRKIAESEDIYTIRERLEYKKGVNRKHMVWMLNRTLSALGYAHNLGIVHGNIEPSHLMVQGRNHNVFVIDWSWAAISPLKTGDQFKIFTEGFSAPEVKRHGPPHPASDIYSIGKCMIYVLGGDIETNEMPDGIEPKLERYLRYLVTDSMAQRPHDAWNEWHFLDRLVRELWGKKKFIPFSTQ